MDLISYQKPETGNPEMDAGYNWQFVDCPHPILPYALLKDQ